MKSMEPIFIEIFEFLLTSPSTALNLTNFMPGVFKYFHMFFHAFVVFSGNKITLCTTWIVMFVNVNEHILEKTTEIQRQITLGIVAYYCTFLPDWQLPLIFVRFISNFLCMCSNSMASAHVILKQIRQRLRVAVSQEEKWYPKILRVICLQMYDMIGLWLQMIN